MDFRAKIALVGVVSFLLSSSADDAQAEDVIAVPKLKGSAKRGTGKAAKGIRAEFRNAGYKVLGPTSMKKAGKRVGAKPRSLEAAREAEAGLLLLGRVKGKKRKTLSVSLIDVSDGRTLETVSKKYRKARSAKKIGRKLARELLPAIEAYFEELNRPKPVAARPVAAKPIPSAEEKTGDDFAEAESAAAAAVYDAPSKPRVVPKDELEEESTSVPLDERESTSSTPEINSKPQPIKVATAVENATDSKAGDKLNLDVQLEGGALIHKYTITVQDVPTGLHYSLALPSFGGRVAWSLPDLGLGLAVFGSFQRIKFDLALVDPPLEPVAPVASMFSAGGEASYRLQLLNWVRLAPVIGVEYTALSVAEQIETLNQTPSSVVLSRNALRPFAGLRTTASLMDQYLDVELDLRYLHTLSYNESPNKTGDSASGMGFDGGLTFRYWLNHWFGVYVGGKYVYSKVNFTGVGDRVNLAVEDQDVPDTLENASAHHSWIYANLGLRMAF